MALKKILVLQSVEDDICLRRVRLIQASVLFQGHAFAWYYAMQMPQEIRRTPYAFELLLASGRMPLVLDERELVESLAERIRIFQPDALVVCYGALLDYFREPILSVLCTLRTRFPHLRIGIWDVHIQPRRLRRAVGLYD